MLKQISVGLKQFSTPMKSSFTMASSVRRFADSTDAPKKSIFLGNLPWETTEADIQSHFSKYGTVTSIKIMKDNQTGRPRGFGFISIDGDADAAITELDGKELKGRVIRVNEAKPQAPRDPSQQGGFRREGGFNNNREGGFQRREGGFRRQRGSEEDS